MQAGQLPLLGRDFFWNLLGLACFAVDATESRVAADFYSVFLQQPKAYKRNMAEVKALELERTNYKLQFIANNEKRGVMMEKWPFVKMLESTGWKVFDDALEQSRVYVPHWNAKTVLPSNYKLFQGNVQYFTDRESDELVDHIAVSYLYCCVSSYFLHSLKVGKHLFIM